MHCNSAEEHFLMDLRRSINTLLPLPLPFRQARKTERRLNTGKEEVDDQCVDKRVNVRMSSRQAAEG